MTVTDKTRVECFMLCDGAEECNGKLFVLGGGWDQLRGRGFPLTHHQLAIAIRLSVPWNDANCPQRFRIESLDEDGNDILPQPLEGTFNVGRPATVGVGDDLSIVLAINMVNLIFPRPGVYVFRLLVEGEELAKTRLRASTVGQVYSS